MVRTERILIVEDDGVVALTIEQCLGVLGFGVAGICETSHQAIARAGELRPSLVLMDIRLKGNSDGIEAADVIRRTWDIPVVYLTAHSDQTTLDRAKLTEPFGYLVKPFEPRALGVAIEMGLYRHRVEANLRNGKRNGRSSGNGAAERAPSYPSHVFQAALQQSDESIVITDADLEAPGPRIVFVSPGFTRMTGYAPEEVVGKNPRILQGPKTDRAVLRLFKKSLALGLPFRGQTTNYRKDGSDYAMEWSVQPIRDEQDKVTHFVAIQRDITDRLQLERRFQAAQKMESIGRLAAGIAHDFNNMLAVIRGNLSLILLDETHPARVKSLRDMDSAVDRAANLTRQLLAFSRRNAIEPRPIDLNVAVEQMARMLRRVLTANIAASVQLEPGLPWVDADPGMVDQIVMNLAVNAQDAMPNGGRLRLATSVFSASETFARINPDVLPGKYVCLEVEDTGCGIEDSIKARIFEPFFTTKELGKGTGLGLSTVYGIVKQHRGWIRVESQVGRGTVFRIYFPASARSVSPVLAPSVDEKCFGSGEGILLVEDEEELRSLAAAVLKRYGYAVFEAADGTAALEQWEMNLSRISLLVTDYLLPEGPSGRELANALRKKAPKLQVIVSSAYSPEFVDPMFTADPSVTFLWKPYPLEELARVVRKTLDARPAMAS